MSVVDMHTRYKTKCYYLYYYACVIMYTDSMHLSAVSLVVGLAHEKEQKIRLAYTNSTLHRTP